MKLLISILLISSLSYSQLLDYGRVTTEDYLLETGLDPTYSLIQKMNRRRNATEYSGTVTYSKQGVVYSNNPYQNIDFYGAAGIQRPNYYNNYNNYYYNQQVATAREVHNFRSKLIDVYDYRNRKPLYNSQPVYYNETGYINFNFTVRDVGQ